jgi:hypothetical protein
MSGGKQRDMHKPTFIFAVVTLSLLLACSASSRAAQSTQKAQRANAYERKRPNNVKRIVFAPYKATKFFGKSIGRGTRRLFTGKAHSRRNKRKY